MKVLKNIGITILSFSIIVTICLGLNFFMVHSNKAQAETKSFDKSHETLSSKKTGTIKNVNQSLREQEVTLTNGTIFKVRDGKTLYKGDKIKYRTYTLYETKRQDDNFLTYIRGKHDVVNKGLHGQIIKIN